MSAWPLLALRELIDKIVGGKNVESGNGSSVYRILKVSAVTSGYFRPDEAKPAPDNYDPSSNLKIRKDDFLFSRANTSALVGAVAIVENDHPDLLLPDKIWRIEWRRELVEPRFAYYLLQTQRVRRVFAQVASGTSDSMKNISQGKLLNIEVPVPPLDEQRRIAGFMDRSAMIRRRADAARAKARAIIPALFLEMFGDPAANPKGWQIAKLGSLLRRIDGGWSPVCGDGAPTLDEWGVLKLSAVKSTGFMGAEAKRLPETIEPRRQLEVQEGDILFTRKNTIDLVGTAAIADSSSYKRILPDTIFRLIPNDRALLVPRYLSTLINLHSFRPAIKQLASGSASSMPGISKGRLSALELPVPDGPLQTAFAEQAERVDGTARALDAAAAKAEAAVAALSARVFA